MAVFEWDEAKRIANIRKHGIDFKACIAVFEDRSSFDIRSDRGEEARCTLIGPLDRRVIAVIYTLRGDRLRIISARAARKAEVERWNADIS